MTLRKVLTGTGSVGTTDAFIDEGGGAGGLSSLPILQDDVLVGDAESINFTGARVSVDGVDPNQINVDVGQRQVASSATVNQYALIKVSGNGTYAMLGAADDAVLCVGVALTAVVGAGNFIAQFGVGTITTMLSDGTGVIANGASVVPSTSVAGRIKAGTTNSVGINTGAAAAAVLDTQVSVL